jgi:predicted RNase H-like HicB family nuclease
MIRVRMVNMKLLVTLERDETGMIVAECPAIPGCVSQGRSEDEAMANVREAIAVCLEARAEAGMPLTVAVRQVEVGV